MNGLTFYLRIVNFQDAKLLKAVYLMVQKQDILIAGRNKKNQAFGRNGLLSGYMTIQD